MRTRRPATPRERANKRKGGRASAKLQAGAGVPLKRSVGWYKRLQTNDGENPAKFGKFWAASGLWRIA